MSEETICSSSPSSSSHALSFVSSHLHPFCLCLVAPKFPLLLCKPSLFLPNFSHFVGIFCNCSWEISVSAFSNSTNCSCGDKTFLCFIFNKKQRSRQQIGK